MASAVTRTELTRAEQFEILAGLHPRVIAETAAHLERRRLWFPESLLPASAEGERVEEIQAELRAAARALPDTVRVSLAMNLLTEEGLPHFHRLIVIHLGSESPWSNWNNLWTAEEDRHGCILRDYVRDARLFDMGALEQMQYRYIEAGFNPDWERDPYRLLAYTSLQERATQMAHANTGRACAAYESTAQRILANVSGDESRHYQFYRNMFDAILEADPDRALYALLKVMPALAMPGHTIPGYDQMAEVIRRADIYGPRQYQKIVEELLDFWKIGALEGLTAVGRECQDKLMKVPARLARMADYLDTKASPRDFHFDFLYERLIHV